MIRSLLILGCGGHGRVVADTALDCGYEEIAFLDDAPQKRLPRGAKLLGPIAAAGDFVRAWPTAIAAVGNGHLRQNLFARLRAFAYRTPNIVHPSAIISRGVTLGEGIFIAAGAIVNVDASIGDAVIINTGARIDHDCRISSASHIAPGATLSGGVVVGERVWLGTGCCVRQGVEIGNDAVVGVGAAVVGDLAGGRTYAGVPARILGNL